MFCGFQRRTRATLNSPCLPRSECLLLHLTICCVASVSNHVSVPSTVTYARVLYRMSRSLALISVAVAGCSADTPASTKILRNRVA